MFFAADQGGTTRPGGPGSPDLSTVPTAEVEEEIARLAAEIAATTCRWLELVAEFERRGAHEDAGHHSCASWLAWRCSLNLRTARDQLRVARRLGELPLTRELFSRGELSYSKVRAIARVSRNPEMEAELVEMARYATASQLERIASATAGALSRERAEENFAGRFLSWEWEEEGTLGFRGRLDGEEGALLLRALEAGCEALRREEQAGERAGRWGEGAGPSSADALVAMAEALLASGPVSRTAHERQRVVVHVEAGVLAGESAEGACQIEDGPPVSAETARRLACEAPVTIVGDANGSAEPRTRSIPSTTRRAVRIRDRGCRFPGCENRLYVDAHHIVHWAEGGKSTTENLVQLCRRHHRLVHEGGFGVERGDHGGLTFRRPNGDEITLVPPLSPSPRSKRLRGAAQVEPMPEALGGGGPYSLDLAVSGLCISARAGPGP